MSLQRLQISKWAPLSWFEGGRLVKPGRLLTFSALKKAAHSKGVFILAGTLFQISTVHLSHKKLYIFWILALRGNVEALLGYSLRMQRQSFIRCKFKATFVSDKLSRFITGSTIKGQLTISQILIPTGFTSNTSTNSLVITWAAIKSTRQASQMCSC